MKKIITAAVVLVAVITGLTISASAEATTVTTNSKFPISLSVFVPCAAGGAGEFIDLSGELHELYHVTLDNRGGFHLKLLGNPQGVIGIGQTSGDRYQGTGVTQSNLNGKVGFENTLVNNFRIIGQGAGTNFLVHENFHITVHPDGTVSSFHDDFRVACK